MKIITPSVERITETDPLKKIELAGRTCYKSEDKITETSAAKFVEDKVKLGHESVIEHAQFILKMPIKTYRRVRKAIYDVEDYGVDVMLRTTNITVPLISGNARMWRDFFTACALYDVAIPAELLKLATDNPVLFPELVEMGAKFNDSPITYVTDPESLSDVEQLVHVTATFKITCDRGVTHELVRHRKASFSQESTRYCNYSKGKYDGQITVIKPNYWSDRSTKYATWVNAMQTSEDLYLTLSNLGASAQESRAVLPNSLKTELIMSATLEEWRHILELRCDPAAHPQCRQVCALILADLQNEYPDLFEGIDDVC